jgi:hypothetical protein
MTSNKLPLLGLLALLSLGSGCSRRMIFVTHSSLGLNVSGTAQMPNKVAFDYSRYEATLVPRKTNGEAQPVFGGLDADVNFWRGNHIIREAFATGDAADIASGAKNFSDTSACPPEGTGGTPSRSLFFMSGTTYGLHINLGEQATPPNLVLGYQRHTATIIPVQSPEQKAGSVYADVSINTTEPEAVANGNVTGLTNAPAAFSNLKGTRIRQFFATGLAAKKLAEETPVRKELRALAGTESTKEFLGEMDQQGKIIEKIRQIYQKSPTNQAKIRAKAVSLGLAAKESTEPLTFLADLDSHADGRKASTTLFEQLREYARNPQ